jgi:glycosyltransferase involved in cell wall biosynthesis
MYKKVLLSSLLIIPFICFGVSKKDVYIPEFVFVIPSYNNEKWVEKNLDSLIHQRSTKPFHMYYVNDASTDATKIKVDEYIKKHKLEHLITVIHNKERIGALANIYNTIHTYCKDEQVVVLWDGDDWAVDSPDVLLVLEKAYSDPDVWITYGRARCWPSQELSWGGAIPRSILEDKKLRSYPFMAEHLRTFKAGLFKKIDKKDLVDAEGNFFSMTYDIAITFPMLEMGAPKSPKHKDHTLFIEQPLYVYNCQNPISDIRVNKRNQVRIEYCIRAKKPYEPLESLLKR